MQKKMSIMFTSYCQNAGENDSIKIASKSFKIAKIQMLGRGKE